MHIHIKIADMLTKLFDEQFYVFGVRFGLDPVLGLVPGIGDVISLFVSLYIIWIATQYNIPTDKIAQMLQHVFVDFLIGIIPVVGDVGDIFYKANRKNLKIIYEHIPTIVDATPL